MILPVDLLGKIGWQSVDSKPPKFKGLLPFSRSPHSLFHKSHGLLRPRKLRVMNIDRSFVDAGPYRCGSRISGIAAQEFGRILDKANRDRDLGKSRSRS
jgi:hypothetical protein